MSTTRPTVYLSIRNDDERTRLYQDRWASYARTFLTMAAHRATKLRGAWLSSPDAPFQSACIAIELTEFGATVLRKELLSLARSYGQESITWSEAHTSVLTPEAEQQAADPSQGADATELAEDEDEDDLDELDEGECDDGCACKAVVEPESAPRCLCCPDPGATATANPNRVQVTLVRTNPVVKALVDALGTGQAQAAGLYLEDARRRGVNVGMIRIS